MRTRPMRLTAVLVGLASSGLVSSPALADYYSVNPTLGAAATAITVDGSNTGEWSASNLIALDLANDDPRTLGDAWSMHEAPFDLTHLYAAWDDDNLYLAWQYVDVTDVLDPSNAGSAGASSPGTLDLIQWIAIDTREGAGAPLDMWGKNGGEPYWSGADKPDFQIYIAGNLWQGFVSEAVDGVFPVDDGGVHYFPVAGAGIDVAVGRGLASSTLWGVEDADHAVDSGRVVDFMTRGHAATRDTLYEMSIPLSFLHLTRAQLEANGLGVMIGQGEMSCVDTVPNDPATSDTVGVSPSNSPLEWGDIDALSADFARVGARKSGAPDPCATVTCDDGERCVNGSCVPTTTDDVGVDTTTDVADDADPTEDVADDTTPDDTSNPDVPDDVAPSGVVSWSPTSPTVHDLITVSAPAAGWLHWGVDGWTEPAAADWPAETVVATAGQSVETPLTDPDGDGNWTVDIGPFESNLVHTVDFVIRYQDGQWDNNGGQDYHIDLGFDGANANNGLIDGANNGAANDGDAWTGNSGNDDADEGCGCAVPTSPLGSGLPVGLLVAVLGLLVWRRRARLTR